MVLVDCHISEVVRVNKNSTRLCNRRARWIEQAFGLLCTIHQNPMFLSEFLLPILSNAKQGSQSNLFMKVYLKHNSATRAAAVISNQAATAEMMCQLRSQI